MSKTQVQLNVLQRLRQYKKLLEGAQNELIDIDEEPAADYIQTALYAIDDAIQELSEL